MQRVRDHSMNSQILKALRELVLVQSVESSNRIEGITLCREKRTGGTRRWIHRWRIRHNRPGTRPPRDQPRHD